MSIEQTKINEKLPFEFMGVTDCGETCCPCCGADGRYIYTWHEFGKVHSAMAGCYKRLTGKLEKNDLQKMMVKIAEKQSRNKPLNGWQRTIVRMQQFKEEGKYSPEWCDEKINEALQQSKIYASGGR